MLEIEPGAERRSRAVEHNHACAAVAPQPFEIRVERIYQAGVERVEAVRAIERHPVDSVLVFDQQRLGHAALPILSSDVRGRRQQLTWRHPDRAVEADSLA